MKNKIILYIGLGILAVAMVLGVFVLGNGIKFAANNNTYKNGTLTERVEAAEKKTEAQKALTDLAIYAGATVVVGGGIVAVYTLKQTKKRGR